MQFFHVKLHCKNLNLNINAIVDMLENKKGFKINVEVGTRLSFTFWVTLNFKFACIIIGLG